MLHNPLMHGSTCFKTLPCKEGGVCTWQKYMRSGLLLLTHSNYKSVNFGSSYSHLVVNYGKGLPLPVKSRGKVLSTYNANVCGTL